MAGGSKIKSLPDLIHVIELLPGKQFNRLKPDLPAVVIDYSWFTARYFIIDLNILNPVVTSEMTI
jgi:hypothetical protein